MKVSNIINVKQCLDDHLEKRFDDFVQKKFEEFYPEFLPSEVPIQELSEFTRVCSYIFVNKLIQGNL